MSIRNCTSLVVFSFSLLFTATAVATPIPGAVVWFDAGDFDGDGNLGNNPSIGTAVGTWVDKASSVQGIQSASNANGAQQPLYTNFQNGQHALNFTSTKILSTTSNVSLGAMTYFVAFQSTGTSLLIAERGANINVGGVNGEFLDATTGTTWRVKRPGGDSQKDYVANWGNTNVPTTATFLFDGTNASQRLLVNGSGVTLTGGTDVGNTVVSAQLNIGNRSTSPTIGFIGGIAELMAYDSALGSAQVNIVNNYLSAKYATPLSVALNFYDGDSNANGDYDFDVFGIGREADGAVTSGTYGTGLTLAEANSSLSNGDYLLAGRTLTAPNGLVSTDLAGTDSQQRLGRVWALDKTGTLDATITFNLADLGVSLPGGENFSLLYRNGISGNFTDLGLLETVAGTNVSFTVLNASLLDGFYTLGITPPAPEPNSMLLMLGVLGCSAVRRKKSRK